MEQEQIMNDRNNDKLRNRFSRSLTSSSSSPSALCFSFLESTVSPGKQASFRTFSKRSFPYFGQRISISRQKQRELAADRVRLGDLGSTSPFYAHERTLTFKREECPFETSSSLLYWTYKGGHSMKFYKPLLVLGSFFLLAGCAQQEKLTSISLDPEADKVLVNTDTDIRITTDQKHSADRFWFRNFRRKYFCRQRQCGVFCFQTRRLYR